jgi:5-methylcytosine-specific restriction endonuclease McrA
VVSDESGRLSRLVRSATRRALQRRDRGCRYLGCDRPSSWSDAHHLVHWADGGETRLSNLVLLCRRHHRMVHEGRVPLRL